MALCVVLRFPQLIRRFELLGLGFFFCNDVVFFLGGAKSFFVDVSVPYCSAEGDELSFDKPNFWSL